MIYPIACVIGGIVLAALTVPAAFGGAAAWHHEDYGIACGLWAFVILAFIGSLHFIDGPELVCALFFGFWLSCL